MLAEKIHILTFLPVLSSWQYYLLLLFFILFTVKVYSDLILLFKVLFPVRKESNTSVLPFSIFMAIRNEEENLKNNLPKILTSDYPKFNVVVVDDFSQDQSYTILGLLQEKYPSLKISCLNQETRHSSKMATNIALKAATNEWVILCPVSASDIQYNWLISVNESIVGNTSVVINYSNIEREKGFFNLLYRIELFQQQLKSYLFIKLGAGFIVNEENIAFKKQKYFDLGGFVGVLNEEYANLELVLNRFVNKKNTTLNINPQSSIQKKRHITFNKYKELVKKLYRIEHNLPLWKRTLLFIYEAINLIYLPILVLCLLFVPKTLWLVAALAGFKLILYILVIFIVLNRLNQQKILLSSLLYELLAPYYKVVLKWVFYRSSQKRKWRT